MTEHQQNVQLPLQLGLVEYSVFVHLLQDLAGLLDHCLVVLGFVEFVEFFHVLHHVAVTAFSRTLGQLHQIHLLA